MIKTLLFDVDGVLADTEHLHQQALALVTYEAGYTVPDIDARATVDKLRAAGVPEPELQALYAKKRAMYEQLLEGVPKNPELATALYSLYGKGMRMAACTNSNRVSTTKLLQHIGVYGVFSTIVSTSDVDRGKPAPDIYLSALERLACRPHQVVVFEDSEIGIEAARNAGIVYIVRCTTSTLVKELNPWLS